MFKRKCVITLLVLFVLSCLPCFAADITLRWDANTETDLAGYKLYYKTDVQGVPYNGTGALEGNSPVDIPLANLVDINNPEFTITDLDAAHVYFLVITAYDDAGNESGYSNEVSTFYISSPQNGFYVNSTNYTSFNVSGRGAAGYDVNVYSDDELVGTTIADANGAWYVDADFTGITEGTINISARTTVVNEITSNTVTGTLDITAPAPPEPPQSLTVVAVSKSQVDLTWEPVAGATGYTVYRDDSRIADTPDTNYSDTGLAPSTTYEYEVASYYTANNPSNKSDLESATTLDENNTPSTGGGSSGGGGCFISSTEKTEKLLIKVAFGFFFLSILAVSIIGFELIISIVKRFNSNVRTIILTSSIIIAFVMVFGDLSYKSIPADKVIVVASLFFLGVCNILIISCKTIRSFIK